MDKDRFARRLPLYASALTLVLAAAFEWLAGPGDGIQAILLLAFLAIAGTSATIIAWMVAKRLREKLLALIILPMMAFSLICFFFAVIFVSDHRGRIAFEIWYPFHHARVDALRAKNGGVMLWGNRHVFVYDEGEIAEEIIEEDLVVDKTNSFDVMNVAMEWVQQRAPNCDLLKIEKMRDGLYILTTYDCGLYRS
jgi:hypothetical protein